MKYNCKKNKFPQIHRSRKIYDMILKKHSLVSCESLPSSWKQVETESQFPIPPGSEVSLKCSPGHSLTGDDIVTCDEGTTFLFNDSPSCVLGEVMNNLYF